MSKKAGYYIDKDGATWLRLGGRWGPMRLDLLLGVD